MAQCNVVLCVLTGLALMLTAVHGEVEADPEWQLCVGCICEAISNCSRSLQCNGDVCGVFYITWSYWSDAGKPLLDPKDDIEVDAYPRCANDPKCAARAVAGYMNKHTKDCNGDGVVNCSDYAAIHKLGGYGCKGDLDTGYQNRFLNCMKDSGGLR